MKPIKLLPAFKDYLWGGTRLREEYNKVCDLEKVAESWELSTHKDGQSIVACGEDKGLKLTEYIEKYGRAILGKNALKFDFFPILIKFIDARDNLSIQVHPDDEYALKNAGEYGKTEMWYILDAAPDAFLYYGFNKEITKEEYKKRIEDNTLLEVLNDVPVKKGDVFFIEAGTVHAIGKGIVICEIQQNSNITYRVYDYDRRDKNGNPRELHVEKAIEVSDLKPVAVPEFKGENILSKCKYFTVEKYDISDKRIMNIDDNSFKSVIVTDGEGTLIMNDTELELKKGDSVFIPSQNATFELIGKLDVIISYV